MRKLRRDRSVRCDAVDATRGYRVEDIFQAFDVHCFRERLFHGFVYERMIGNRNVAGNVLLTCESFRKHGREKIVGTHTLNLWSDSFPAHKSQKSKRATGGPSPTCCKDW